MNGKTQFGTLYVKSEPIFQKHAPADVAKDLYNHRWTDTFTREGVNSLIPCFFFNHFTMSNRRKVCIGHRKGKGGKRI